MKPSSFPPPRSAHTRTFGVVALLAAAALVTACSFTRPSPVKRTYLLEPVAPPAAAAQKPGTLRIGALAVAAPFRGRQLVYRSDELSYESDFYSEFFVAPAAMLSESTARALVAANLFKRIIPPGAAPEDGDYVLDGFVNELYGDARDPAKPAAALSITYYLSVLYPASGPSVIWSREYRQHVPISGTNADSVVRAWNVALTAILADLARDLSATNLPQK